MATINNVGFITTLNARTGFPVWGPNGEDLGEAYLDAGASVEIIDVDVPDADVPNITISPVGMRGAVTNVFLADITIHEIYRQS